MRLLVMICMLSISLLSQNSAHAAPQACMSQMAGVCTMDINICGYASMCQCSPGYLYHPASGQCLKQEMAGVKSGMHLPASIPNGACDVPAQKVCTKGNNECGYAQLCQCPEGYTYNQASGRCLVTLEYR